MQYWFDWVRDNRQGCLIMGAVSEYDSRPGPLRDAVVEAMRHWREATARALIVEWLERPRLAPARPYLFDPLLRRLYWANLLATRRDADGAWLEWRCQAIREAARMIATSFDTDCS